MTHFRFILDWNNCLLKKIRLGHLQSVQTYPSHESFTGKCAYSWAAPGEVYTSLCCSSIHSS